MASKIHDLARTELEQRSLTAALLHELRTPLAALTTEVEVALRRSRTPAAYREVLVRVAEQAAELSELIRDLAVLAHPDAFRNDAGATTDLGILLRDLAARFDGDAVVVYPVPPNIVVAGDQALLARALHLLLDHGVRHRPSESSIRLRAASNGFVTAGGAIELTVDTAAGFQRTVWRDLGADQVEGELTRSGQMRLNTASHIVRLCGGRLAVDGDHDRAVIRITLPIASA